MAIAVSGSPADVQTILQQNLLLREFRDALFPRLLWRKDLDDELWGSNLGETKIMTRTGNITPDTNALTPGNDPTQGEFDVEQWRVTASQLGKTVNVNMATSNLTLASIYMENGKKLGMHAGQSMNRLSRNKQMSAYLGGQANAAAAALISATQILVSSINGFSEQLLNGQLSPVSAANPITVTFPTGTAAANTVIAAIPADVDQPLGAGLITLGAPLSAGVALREVVLSANAAIRQRAGGAASIDGITAASLLTVADIEAAVTRLRRMNVPTFPDGTYHAYLSPEGEQQLFQDNAWQRLYQSLPGSDEYSNFVINKQFGVTFYRDNELPNAETVSATDDTGGFAVGAPEIGADIRNNNGAAGVPIARAFVYGAGCAREFYIDESKYMSAAGATGKIGSFNVINGGYYVMTDRIRYIIRSPLDQLQQQVSQSWSWSGDFAVPSDQTTGDGARFKRAVVIEHVGV